MTLHFAFARLHFSDSTTSAQRVQISLFFEFNQISYVRMNHLAIFCFDLFKKNYFISHARISCNLIMRQMFFELIVNCMKWACDFWLLLKGSDLNLALIFWHLSSRLVLNLFVHAYLWDQWNPNNKTSLFMAGRCRRCRRPVVWWLVDKETVIQ